MWINDPKPVITPPKKFLMPKAHRDMLFTTLAWWDATPDQVKESVLDADEFNEDMSAHVLDLFFDNCTNVHKAEDNEDPPYIVRHFEIHRNKVYAMIVYDHKVDEDKVEIVGV